MKRHRASWVLPVSGPPLRNGSVVVDAGRIIAVGGEGDASGHDGIPTVDWGPVALLPGLVNAHTHLELSWMRAMVPPSTSMPEWAMRLIALRREAAPDSADAIERAVTEAYDAGTVLIGDISNTLASVPALARGPVSAVVFYELLKFNPADPEAQALEARRRLDAIVTPPHVRLTLAAHAPYSVAGSLFRAIRANVPDAAPYAVHLAESAAEVEFLRNGGGAWRHVLERLGAWDETWNPPGTGAVEYLASVGFLGNRLIAAHGVQLDDGELGELRRVGATLVTCPRSNHWTGAGSPPLDRFYAAGVRVAVGTDSLASAPDLNLFSELMEMRRLAPRIPASTLIESATLAGARALGFDQELGSIEPGKQSALLAIPIPGHVDDVEEYLLRGVTPDRVRWIDEQGPGRDA